MRSGPRIPDLEYPMRWAKVQEVLARRGLDALLAYSDDRATYGPAYARYFADFPTHFEPTLLLFTPGREPMLLVGPETEGYAREAGKVRDVRTLKELASEHEDYPFTTLHGLAEVLSEALGGAPRWVGLAGVPLMGADLHRSLLGCLGGAGIARTEDDLDGLRAVKSEAEIDVIRHCYRIAERGMEAAVAAVAPGVLEREVAAAAEQAMRGMGSEGTGIDTIAASGPNTRHVLARSTFRAIGRDDAVLITVAPRYEGYHGAMARTVLVGDPDPRAVASVEAADRAMRRCAALLAPGAVGSRIEAEGRRVMADAGFDGHFLYSGLHSVGVTEFEPPILGPSSGTALEAGMVISIDIPLFEADFPGSRTENGYLLNAGGAEPLCRMENVVRK